MARLSTSALALFLAGLRAVSAQQPALTGTGQILVLNTTSLSDQTTPERVGCLDVNGAVVADNCATFTVSPAGHDDSPHLLSTEAGRCSFTDVTQPTNSDSVYGRDDHAFHCWDHPAASSDTSFYTVNGFPRPYLCTGDVRCFFDLKSIPDADSVVPTWFYRWGSQQKGVVPGHAQTVWLWTGNSA